MDTEKKRVIICAGSIADSNAIRVAVAALQSENIRSVVINTAKGIKEATDTLSQQLKAATVATDNLKKAIAEMKEIQPLCNNELSDNKPFYYDLLSKKHKRKFKKKKP